MNTAVKLSGGIEVSANVKDTGLWLQGAVNGEIVVIGGKTDLSVNNITLKIREYWPQTRRLGGNEVLGQEGLHGVFDDKRLTVRSNYTRRKVELASSFELKRGAARRFCFETPFPQNGISVTTRHSGWVMEVALDIPGGEKLCARFKLDVLPCGVTAAILRTCESVLGFVENLEHRHWNFQAKEARFRLMPPERLRTELDHLEMRLARNKNDELTGEMIFDLQEKKLGDYFRALINRDKVAVPLSLSREQCTLPNGSFNTEAIAKLVRFALEKVVKDRKG